MLGTRGLKTLMIISALLIGINSGCFLQPVNQVVREVHFIGYDAPAMRLGKSVKGELWSWNEKEKKWMLEGVGMIPAGTLMKFEKPREDIRNILKEENNGQ